MLPGYQATTDDAARRRLGELWGAPLPEIEGMGMAAALEGARQGTVKAMLLLGDGASLNDGEQGAGYEALDKLELLIVHDSFLGEAARRAHVVLPAATFAEEDGTYTNLERRVQLLSRVISPANTEAEQAWRTLCRIARQMGAQGFDFESAEQVFDEAASVTDIYGGISHRRLRREAVLTLRPDPLYPQPTQLLYSDRVSQGIQWPCLDEEDEGTAVLYADGFPPGKALLMAVDSPSPLPEQPADFPLMLTPGRVLLQEGRDTVVFNEDGMNRIRRDEQVELHPESAAALGLSDGESVSVVSETDRWDGTVRVTDTVAPGVVSMTTLFGELAVALQASEEPDPMARVPGLVVQAVRLERVAD
jgi:predicted molibdopterin-dependent oxidoreductase YjgC